MDNGFKKNGPVNHFTRGYIAAIFAAGFEKPARSFEVKENKSIVTGAGTSSFSVEKKQVG
jgi:predicted hydrocarbon binding protein